MGEGPEVLQLSSISCALLAPDCRSNVTSGILPLWCLYHDGLHHFSNCKGEKPSYVALSGIWSRY